MLVFFTFMPLGAAIGGVGGALLFGIIAIRDAEIAIEHAPSRSNDRQVIGKPAGSAAFVQCKYDNCVSAKLPYV